MDENKKVRVCMISCRHSLLDDRIYKKEALTLQKNGYEVIHIGYGDENEEYVTTDNIRLIQLRKQYKGNSFTTLYSSLKQSFLNDIFLKAKEAQADIYHLQDVELCRIAPKLKKLPHHPKIIYDAHEPYPENLKDKWKERSCAKLLLNDLPAIRAEKNILKKMDFLIATESNVAARFVQYNPNTAIIYNYSFFEPLTELPACKKYDLIYCGALAESKGIDIIVPALIRAKKEGLNLHSVFVGAFTSAELEAKMKRLIKENELENNITFTGAIPIEEIRQYYIESKIALCVFPSDRTNRLILPIKLFEYMAFGLPVIGSDFGHVGNIINENNAGFTVDSHNEMSIVNAIAQLLNNDEYKKYFAGNTTAVSEKYSWKNEEPKLLGIYRKLMSS